MDKHSLNEGNISFFLRVFCFDGSEHALLRLVCSHDPTRPMSWLGCSMIMALLRNIHNEPSHDKTNKMACAFAQTDQSLRCPHEESLGP